MTFPVSYSRNLEVLPELFQAPDHSAAARLADEGYEVRVGFTPQTAIRVSDFVTQTHILEHTGLEYCSVFRAYDAFNSARQVDPAKIEDWLANEVEEETLGRACFVLRPFDRPFALAGFGWSAPAHHTAVSGGATTMGLIMESDYRKRGLATPFARLIMESSAALYGARKFWAANWASNVAATKVLVGLGFHTVNASGTPAERPVPGHFGSRIADHRLIMRCPDALLPVEPPVYPPTAKGIDAMLARIDSALMPLTDKTPS